MENLLTISTDLELFEEFLRKNKALTKFKKALWEEEKILRTLYKIRSYNVKRKNILKKDVWEEFKKSAEDPRLMIMECFLWKEKDLKYWSDLHKKWLKYYDFIAK